MLAKKQDILEMVFCAYTNVITCIPRWLMQSVFNIRAYPVARTWTNIFIMGLPGRYTISYITISLYYGVIPEVS